MVLQNFIVEGDAKICFDAINDGTTVCPWIFSNLIHNITNCRSLLFLVIFVGQKESKCFSFIFCMPLSDPLTVVIRTLFLNLFGVCRRRMSVVVHLFVLNEIGIFFPLIQNQRRKRFYVTKKVGSPTFSWAVKFLFYSQDCRSVFIRIFVLLGYLVSFKSLLGFFFGVVGKLFQVVGFHFFYFSVSYRSSRNHGVTFRLKKK